MRGMMQVDVDGAKIAYDVNGSGTPVVFLHGYPLSRAMWDAQRDALITRARVIRIDFRGMGSSTTAPGPYLMESLAADVSCVLDAIGIERVSIAGHSMGGYVAMAFARMFTERVERLALVCSRLDADSQSRITERNRMADQLEAGEITAVNIAGMFANADVHRQPDVAARALKMVQGNDLRGLAQMQRGLALRVDSSDIAAELDLPVLIIGGQLDHMVPSTITQEMAQAFPQARLDWCEASGHLAPMEEPNRVSALLADWLGLK